MRFAGWGCRRICCSAFDGKVHAGTICSYLRNRKQTSADRVECFRRATIKIKQWIRTTTQTRSRLRHDVGSMDTDAGREARGVRLRQQRQAGKRRKTRNALTAPVCTERYGGMQKVVGSRRRCLKNAFKPSLVQRNLQTTPSASRSRGNEQPACKERPEGRKRNATTIRRCSRMTNRNRLRGVRPWRMPPGKAFTGVVTGVKQQSAASSRAARDGFGSASSEKNAVRGHCAVCVDNAERPRRNDHWRIRASPPLGCMPTA